MVSAVTCLSCCVMVISNDAEANMEYKVVRVVALLLSMVADPACGRFSSRYPWIPKYVANAPTLYVCKQVVFVCLVSTAWWGSV